MEGKNIITAVILSTAVLLLWAVFFEMPESKLETKDNTQQTKNIEKFCREIILKFSKISGIFRFVYYTIFNENLEFSRFQN